MRIFIFNPFRFSILLFDPLKSDTDGTSWEPVNEDQETIYNGGISEVRPTYVLTYVLFRFKAHTTDMFSLDGHLIFIRMLGELVEMSMAI